MKITPTKLDGIYTIEPPAFKDRRGRFVKTFHRQNFRDAGLNDDFAESYYSISRRHCIRGMHFQIPPADHAKLVYVSYGAALDVVLDIRRGSPTYGQFLVEELTGQRPKMIYIPQGFAHGFLALKDGTHMTYLQTTVHSPEHDRGIAADSFGFDWPVNAAVMSDRDRAFPGLAEFESPFRYQV